MKSANGFRQQTRASSKKPVGTLLGFVLTTYRFRRITKIGFAGAPPPSSTAALSGKCGTVRHLGRPALALAMCSDTAQAEKLVEETSKLFPNGTLWNTVQLPEIRAAIELQRDQPAKALELLASASPYERAYPEAVYLRGLAYLRLHKGAEAAGEFQKILNHKGASWGSTWLYPNWGLYYIRFPTWGWRVAPCSRATRRKPEEPSKISSHCGRMPTRISLS
jgi:hypothetical protein